MSEILSEYFNGYKELAKEMGVCERTTQRWDALGEGPPKTKIGNRVLFHKESVREWLFNRQQKRT